MEQLFDFLVRHYFLTGTLILLVMLLIKMETSSVVKGMEMLSSQQVITFLNHENAYIIDIRKNELYEKGHIINAHLMQAEEITNNLNKLNKYKKRPIIFVCQNGQQSPKFGLLLKKKGFDKIYGLKGGMQSWLAEDLPIVSTQS